MKLSKQWFIVGFSFLILSLIDYLRLLMISPQDILFICMGVFLLISGLFEIRKYYDKILYFSLVFVILLAMAVFYVKMLVNQSNLLLYYVLGVIFMLVILWSAYIFYHKLGEYKNVIESYDKTLERDPYNTTILNNKGTALVNLMEYQEAIKYFDRVLKIDHKDTAALHNKGVALEKIKKHQEAIKYYDRALRIDPKFEIAKKAGKIILEA